MRNTVEEQTGRWPQKPTFIFWKIMEIGLKIYSKQIPDLTTFHPFDIYYFSVFMENNDGN
jgi:hypothetical protein